MEDVILKKTNTVKRYIKARKVYGILVYTKSIKRLDLENLKEHPNIDCSRSTFVKYRPFYIEVSTEREKQFCLCIVCQNAHTKLRGINTFRKLKKLQPIYTQLPNTLSYKKLMIPIMHCILNGVQRKT